MCTAMLLLLRSSKSTYLIEFTGIRLFGSKRTPASENKPLVDGGSIATGTLITSVVVRVTLLRLGSSNEAATNHKMCQRSCI